MTQERKKECRERIKKKDWEKERDRENKKQEIKKERKRDCFNRGCTPF
jgi:hypothetical protein